MENLGLCRVPALRSMLGFSFASTQPTPITCHYAPRDFIPVAGGKMPPLYMRPSSNRFFIAVRSTQVDWAGDPCRGYLACAYEERGAGW